MKVVKLLENMLKESNKESVSERLTFAKFKCYCDDNEREKKDSIEDLTKKIGFLEAKIEELKGAGGKLTQEILKLNTDMNQNEATRKSAEALRTQAHENFLSEESDMENGIGGFGDAIKVLAELGGDSFVDTTPDRKKFMNGHSQALVVKSSLESLSKAKETVRGAIAAVSSMLTPEERKSVDTFLQSHSHKVTQSGAIVKILKLMLETFKDNLKNARDAEKAEKKSYEDYKEDLEDEYKLYKKTRGRKEGLLSGADDELATKKEQLSDSIETKEDDEDFLEKLVAMCSKKTKQYEERKMLRANENAAIAEAISILNSDDAFATFGKTDATDTGATGPAKFFLQMSSVRKRVAAASVMSVSSQVEAVLRRGILESKSLRLQKVASMLQGENPFDKVIAEIEKMLKVVEEEGKADKEQLDWCNDERTANDAELSKRTEQIGTLESQITGLEDEIDNPETGLKAQIVTTGEDLETNAKTQKVETKTRREEHAAFMEDVATMEQAQSIMKRAIHVLNRYYNAMDKQIEDGSAGSLNDQDDAMQQQAPKMWDDKFAGKSESGKEVLDMLEFILGESDKEETEARADEKSSKDSYDESMTTLKDEEENLQEQLVNLKQTLAEKEKDLMNKNIDLKDTKHAKKAIEKYIKETDPGCDFITENFDTREENRRIETGALEKADTLIKATPAYQKFEAKAK